VALVLGAKLEHNDYTGFENEPTARLRWTSTSGQTLWGAVSRAVRMPTRFDTDLRFTGFTPSIWISGSADFQSETVVSGEVGYRKTLGTQLAFDVSAFDNHYDLLRSQEPTLPAGSSIVIANNLQAHTRGVEPTADYRPATRPRLHAAYSFLDERLTFRPGSHDTSGARAGSQRPTPSVVAASRGFAGSNRSRCHASIRGRAAEPGGRPYAELDVHFGWRARRFVELSIVGNDLLHAQHVEFGNLSPPEALPRSVYARTSWRF
jgi:iron complex outermembrane receptor protein